MHAVVGLPSCKFKVPVPVRYRVVVLQTPTSCQIANGRIVDIGQHQWNQDYADYAITRLAVCLVPALSLAVQIFCRTPCLSASTALQLPRV